MTYEFAKYPDGTRRVYSCSYFKRYSPTSNVTKVWITQAFIIKFLEFSNRFLTI